MQCPNGDAQNVEPPPGSDMYLLDANVVSELRTPRPHGTVVAWIEGIADADLYLSAVALGEIQAGIEITRGKDAATAAELNAWADQVAKSCSSCPSMRRPSGYGGG